MLNLLKIKELLKSNGMTQIELAEKLGISKQNLQAIMRNNSTSISTLEQISKILCVSPGYFFDDSYDNEQLAKLIAQVDKLMKLTELQKEEIRILREKIDILEAAN